MKQGVFTFILMTIGLSIASQTPKIDQLDKTFVTELNRNGNPRVAFDQAHYNTTGFQPLTELITRMGFEVDRIINFPRCLHRGLAS